MAGTVPSFLGLEGLHCWISGAGGGIGVETCREFLRNGCCVSAFDKKPLAIESFGLSVAEASRIVLLQGDLNSEPSIKRSFAQASARFGPPHICIANAGITDESSHPSIWELDVEKWDRVNANNVRGTFLTIKHFLLEVKKHQDLTGKELSNVAIVLTGSESGKFGQRGHAEYASGKAGLQYGLVKTVKNEIVQLNSKARINAVSPGWVDTPLIGDRLEDPHEMWAEVHSTTALRKIAQPSDVARAIAFLASHRASGHISGEALSIDGGMEGRLLWRERQTAVSTQDAPNNRNELTTIPPTLTPLTSPRRMRICLSIDFDALSGYLGTGYTPQNTLSDHSAGIFSAKVGVPRLLAIFRKHNISDKVSWFIPGHSMETFPDETQLIVDSGAEIGLHGYSHEGAYAMTPDQEEQVLSKCIKLATDLKGRPPAGYRAPLYQIRESTVKLLQAHNFLYDTSMNAHDSKPYLLPDPFPSDPPLAPDYTKHPDSWMFPTPMPAEPERGSETAKQALVEIPASWYTEDMTPLGFYPYAANSHGYVSVDEIEKMWWNRFDWLWEHECFTTTSTSSVTPQIDPFGSVFPLIWHPESAGRAHVVGMIDRFIGKLVARVQTASTTGGIITFETFEQAALAWRESMSR